MSSRCSPRPPRRALAAGTLTVSVSGAGARRRRPASTAAAACWRRGDRRLLAGLRGRAGLRSSTSASRPMLRHRAAGRRVTATPARRASRSTAGPATARASATCSLAMPRTTSRVTAVFNDVAGPVGVAERRRPRAPCCAARVASSADGERQRRRRRVDFTRRRRDVRRRRPRRTRRRFDTAGMKDGADAGERDRRRHVRPRRVEHASTSRSTTPRRRSTSPARTARPSAPARTQHWTIAAADATSGVESVRCSLVAAGAPASLRRLLGRQRRPLA